MPLPLVPLLHAAVAAAAQWRLHGVRWLRRKTYGSAAAVCPLCQGAVTSELLHLPSIPTNDVILCDDPAAAAAWPVGSFRLTLCHRCGFVFNSDFDPALVEYSARIEETQAYSPHFVRYAESLATDWIDRFGIRGQTVLEVGCGKAEFLSLMCEIGDNRGVGYDPAIDLERIDSAAAHRLTLVPGLFGDAQIGVEADAFVCRHTLEHIADVDGFLSMLHRWSVQRREQPVVLFEVPDVERVFAEVAFWDLFYEHCSYFTTSTLRYAFERAGFDVLDIDRVYDGQYLVLDARPRSTSSPDAAIGLPSDVVDVVARAGRFVDRYRSITERCRTSLERFAADGKTVVLWGGGSKAVSFLTNLGVGELVEFVVDVNPNKQGKYLVGTGHAVLGPEQLRNYADVQLIVMNPVYLDEITHTVEALGVRAQIIAVNDLLAATPSEVSRRR